jgi:hypothetical protein
MKNTPKGQTIPQTVENLQAIMARDAVTILELDKKNQALMRMNTSLQERLAKCRQDSRLRRLAIVSFI